VTLGAGKFNSTAAKLERAMGIEPIVADNVVDSGVSIPVLLAYLGK